MLLKSKFVPLGLMAAALASLATANAAAPSGGLLITRTSSETWQMQLIAGGEARQFSGIVESDVAFGSSKQTELRANLNVASGGSDSVSFTASTDAKLCLRDTGSSGAQIFLGDSLADAKPVSAPVALTSADACGDVALATSSATSASSNVTPNRKYHTGHYIAVMRGSDSQSVMQQAIKPGVVGFMKRYTWRSLETSQGTYNLNEIQSDLSWASSRGMKFIVMIEDKTFKNEKPGPAYLDNYTVKNRPGGYTLLRWDPTVVARWKALVKAIGQKFDSNSAFEGIATQETAPGIDDATLKARGFTAAKYRDAYISMLSDAMVSMPTSRVFWFMNFFPQNQDYIASVATAVASKGVIMGGPDVMPDDSALLNRVYPFYKQFEAKMPLFGQVEPVCYSHQHKSSSAHTKYWTMTELLNYAKTNLHVNYMFWVRFPQASPHDSYDYYDALPVIQSNPTLNP